MSDKQLEKHAMLLFNCGKKYLVSVGLEKQAEDPQVVIKFLEKIKTAEGLDLFEKKLEKIKKMVNKPRYVCRKCARAANEEDYVCKPVSIEPSS